MTEKFGVVVKWGLFVQPDYSVEVVLWLCCVVVGVVTKFRFSLSGACVFETLRGLLISMEGFLSIEVRPNNVNPGKSIFQHMQVFMKLPKLAIFRKMGMSG